MDLTGIGAVADFATTVIGKIWPDKSDQEKLEIANAFALMQGQMKINENEAANSSLFVSGWRPGIGWVCVLALLYQFLIKPLVAFGFSASGHPLPPMPGIDDNLWQLMLGMLGIGGLRSWEKSKGLTR